MHLIFLIHGIFGKRHHMNSMKDVLEETLPRSEYMIHAAQSNELHKSLEGIEIGAMRYFFELLELIDSHPEITHISFVGYSMGGLFARYLVGLLYDATFFKKILPVNFVTFGTPHLGSTLWKNTFKTRCLNGLGRVMLGRAGADLLCRGPNGVLDEMTKLESSFMRGLRQFKHLTLYCNAVGDRAVRFWTAFITDRLPFSKHVESEIELFFYTYNSDPYNPIFLDSNKSKFKAKVRGYSNDSGHNAESLTTLSFLHASIGPLLSVLFSISIYSSIKVYLERPMYVMKKSMSTEKWKSISKQDFRYERTQRIEPSISAKLQTTLKKSCSKKKDADSAEESYCLAEEMIPSDSDSDPDSFNEPTNGNYSIKQRKISTQPRSCGKLNFVDSCPHKIPFNPAMELRKERLNSLPWEKFVVYLEHRRVHAHIIDRLGEGSSPGKEVLHFFAGKILEA